MSSKRSSKNRKKKGPVQKTVKPEKPKSNSLPPVMLSIQEATLVYELMHDVKVTYMNMKKEERNEGQAKDMIKLCNGIMKKVEVLVIGTGTGEGKKTDD
jgi:hypothetical protein